MNANPAVSAVASIIERIASTVVALDEVTQQRLRDLDGRILAVSYTHLTLPTKA